eukprot:s861_g33.t1
MFPCWSLWIKPPLVDEWNRTVLPTKPLSSVGPSPFHALETVLVPVARLYRGGLMSRRADRSRSPTDVNALRISKAIAAFGRYPSHRPKGLHVDHLGCMQLDDIMRYWGHGQGLEEKDIMHAVRRHMFRETSEGGSLRFALDGDADGRIVVRVMPSQDERPSRNRVREHSLTDMQYEGVLHRAGQVASPLGAMATLVGLGGLSGCPLEVVRALEELGWNVQRLGTLHDEEEEVIGVVLQSLEEHLRSPIDVQVLLGLIEVCNAAAQVAWKVEGSTSGAELLVAHEQRRLQDKLNEWRQVAKKSLLEKVPAKGTAKVTRWPTKLQRRLNAAGDNQNLRDAAERREGALDLGAKEVAVGWRLSCSKRDDGGRRSVPHPWPEEPGEFAQYLECRADEPCGKSVPGSAFKTLMFMENAGEVPVEEQICRSPAIKNVLEEINAQLAERSGGFTRKAWHLPVSIIMALEAMVMKESAKDYVRGYAWFRLVKVWTGMRFSDTCGLLENTVELHGYGLIAVLAKTKTTGPGKKVLHLRIWVNVASWLQHRHWLEVGYDLWKRMGKAAGLADRDFGLPCPTRDLEGFSRRVANYSMASKCSQALFGDLVCEYEGAMVPLLSVGAGLLWSEHSERATIRSWADGLGISPDVKKQLGRWTPTADEGYQRTCRANTLRAQEKMAVFIRSHKGRRDVFDEDAVFAALTSKLDELGQPAGASEVQVEKLRYFGELPQPKKVRLTPHGPRFESDDEISAGGGFRIDNRIFHEVPSLEDEDAELEGDGFEEPLAKAVPAHGTYVLSVVGRCRSKTLHRIGECHRIPGVHYSEFEVVGDNPPEASTFHQSCKICFPRGTGAEEESSGEADDGEVSSSDSSTSVESSSE